MSSESPLPDSDSRECYEHRHLDLLAARWDAKAEAWDRQLMDPSCHLNDDDAYHRFLNRVAAIIAERRDFCFRHGVIDAGCATGLVLAHVISSFDWGVGVDISSQMIRLARNKQVPKAKFLVGDCFCLSAVCPKAGAVLSRGVLLSHYGRQAGEVLLRSIRAALVPGGFMVCDFLNSAGRGKYSHAPENKTYFARAEAHALALRAGFETVVVFGEEERRVLLLVAETGGP